MKSQLSRITLGVPAQWVLTALIFALAFGVTAWRLNQAPDIFTDEIVYTRAGIRVGGEGALAWDSGEPFLIHPPLYFLVEGAYWRLTSNPAAIVYSPGDIFAEVYQARYLNAIFAGLTAVVLFLIGWRLRGVKAGLLLAVLFILDPFALRINRRAMLETMAGFLALAGMAVLLTDKLENNRPSPTRAILAGLLLGAALLAKELTFMALVAVALFGLWETRRGGRAFFLNMLLTVIIALATYSLYPLWIWTNGEWKEFVPVKSLLLQRLLGLVRITGWNRPGVSLADYLLPRLIDYGATYVMFALGGAATMWLLLMHHRDRAARLMSVWGCVLYPSFVFTTLFGTANDQFFYFLLVPAILIIGYTLIVLPEDIVLFLSKYRLTRPLALRADRWIRRGYSLVMLCLLCFIIPFDLTRWWLSYGVGTDNAYQQLAVYAESHLPADAPLNASGDVFKFEYFFPTRSISTANTPQNAESQDIHYFVVVPKDVLLHYGNITPDFAEWVMTYGQLLFTAYGSSYGEVSLYRVDYASNTQPPYAGERHFPPADGEYVSGLLLELALWGLIVTGLIVWLGRRKTMRSFVHVPGAAVTQPVQTNARARGAAVTQPMEAKRERA